MSRSKLFLILLSICLYLVAGGSVIEARYIENLNGTVTDTQTGLMWQQDTAPGVMNWNEALTYCRNLALAGYSDWRLPDIDELESLVNRAYVPSINPDFFPDTRVEEEEGDYKGYWSSTTDADNINNAWNVLFSYGYAYSYARNTQHYVRAVRTAGSTDREIADCIFITLETYFPEYLSPPGASTATLDELFYRYYTRTNTIIGIGSFAGFSDSVLYYGPLAPGVIVPIGSFQDMARVYGCR